MRRKVDDDDDGGLDSLLDTMTNVVGILVLVLIVTQISVADVVTKLTTENQIDDETLAELTQQLVARRQEQDELKRVLIDPLNIDPEQQRRELELKRDLLERRRKELAKKQEEKNQYAMKIEADREQAEKNRKLVADTKAQRDELQVELAQSLERKAELQAKLDSTPKTAAPADIEVSIPNPRPAPSGAKQLVLICAHNELYPLRLDDFRERAEAQARHIIARFKLDRDPAAGIDPKRFTEYWERLSDKDEFFDVEYFVAGERFPRLRFIPRPDDGASEKEIVNPRSRIRSPKLLGAINPEKMYARFFVLPDSFGVYVTARRFFSEAGVLAGWEPQPEDWRYQTGVPGGIELGPPRPPKPTPPPDPDAKPKRPNLID
ncbi:coiled-coil domain-containing protein [Aporhodopirellula aestuarii]|uniref:Uncharacterized protein n=1 Tax=Aporhodopirellula aestuarii TaxID=2950107 RepID=A0ABT0U553_9BACT|nr:hypothetical protein [Aporhodopirellula aestuarii]MCM2372050.1 hypothetical protein [Aporhodopirellula aestuarii]